MALILLFKLFVTWPLFFNLKPDSAPKVIDNESQLKPSQWGKDPNMVPF